MQKVLSRQTYGKRTDSHAYNALDQLAECMCNDSCLQAFTYNTQGIRQSTNKAGDVNRSMLEELLQGECFGTAGDRGAGTLTALPVLQ